MSNLHRNIYIVVLTVLLGILVFVHVALWPKVLEELKSQTRGSGYQVGERLCLLTQEAMLGLWRPHANQLMAWDTQSLNKSFNPSMINSPDTLPGVLGTFYLDFKNGQAISTNSLFLADSILGAFTYRSKTGKGAHLIPGLSGGTRLERRLVAGATKFVPFNYIGKKYPVLIRYMHTDYPSRADDAVGFILDREWFLRRAPTVLDSLAKESAIILMMAHRPSDSQDTSLDTPDPYANILGKQVIGVKAGTDTLWWWGDPATKIRYPYEYNYYALAAFDCTVGASLEHSWNVVTDWIFRSWTAVLIILEVFVCGIVAILLINGISARRQVRRNQIALAH